MRIISAEGELATLKNTVKKDSSVHSIMQEKLLNFKRKIADLEDRNRRCNVQVYGLPENTEKDTPVPFLELMIPVWFPALKHLKPEIERTHRIYSGGPSHEGEQPRTHLLLPSFLYTTSYTP